MTQIQKLKDVAGLLKYIRGQKSFDRIFEKVNVISIGDGKCSIELQIDDEHVNQMGDMHTGLSSSLVDCISGFALMSKIPGIHVSVDIHLNNIKCPKKGENVCINGTVNRIDKNMAFLGAEIRDKVTGEVLVQGTHTKYIL